MRPVRLFDKALFLVLTSAWAAGFALSVRSAVQDLGFMPVLVSGSASSANYPSVSGFAAGMTAERAGLRLGDVDLRGVGNLEFWPSPPSTRTQNRSSRSNSSETASADGSRFGPPRTPSTGRRCWFPSSSRPPRWCSSSAPPRRPS